MHIDTGNISKWQIPPLSFRGRGFTLIEMLAVIVILSLVAGTTLMNASAVTDDAAFRAAAAGVRDLDARARMFGRSGSPAMLMPTEQRDGLVLNGMGKGDVLAFVTMPAGVTIHLNTEGANEEVIGFDALGRSCDYAIVLHRADRVLTLQVCGLTGQVLRTGVQP